MPCSIIDGKGLAGKHLDNIKKYIDEHKIKPKLVTILAGDNAMMNDTDAGGAIHSSFDQASVTYVSIKKKTCESVGISTEIHKVQDEKSLAELVKRLNADKTINGILIQLPLPRSFKTQKIIELIDPSKDVDGIHPLNIGRLSYGDESMPACTPYGIIKILEENTKISGANVAIIGRSTHVGKPLYSMLYNRDATVTMCHTKTKNIENITKNSDIVIVAVGKPNYLKGDMIKENAIIIDVGINRDGKKLVGDSDASVKEKAAAITPVPGGVGPMTVAMLAQNTLNAYLMQN